MNIKKRYFDSLNYNFNIAFSFLVLEQLSRFVIRYIYKEVTFAWRPCFSSTIVYFRILVIQLNPRYFELAADRKKCSK